MSKIFILRRMQVVPRLASQSIVSVGLHPGSTVLHILHFDRGESSKLVRRSVSQKILYNHVVDHLVLPNFKFLRASNQ
jgi:hypothetical protein